MADNIQAISSMKRLIFVENVSNSEAKDLSNTYKYAICFSNDDGHETIWKGGKPYTYIRDVNTDPIIINEHSIGLVYNNGTLSLVLNNIIKSIALGDIFINNYQINNTDNIFSNNNKFTFNVICKDENSQQVNNHASLNFNYESDKYVLSYEPNLNGVDSYTCTINKNDQYTNESDLNNFNITLNGESSIVGTSSLDITYYPQNVSWYSDSNYQNLINNISFTNNNNIKVYFKLDKTELNEIPNGYKLDLYKNGQIYKTKYIDDDKSNYFELEQSAFNSASEYTLKLKLSSTSIINSNSKEFSKNLTVISGLIENSLFYIGPMISGNNINVLQSDIVNSYNEKGWHNFNENYYDYNDNPIEFDNNESWCVIIPENAKLRVNLYNNDINMIYQNAIIDNDSYDISNITVNNTSYKLWRIKDTSIKKFINKITIN